MSDLQDAIDDATIYRYAIECGPKQGDPELIMDAARQVANFDYEAAAKIIYGLRHVTTEDGWDESVPVFTKAAINAALGVSDSEHTKCPCGDGR